MGGADQARRFELVVQFEPQPIQGRLHDREGGTLTERPFSGWLGLMAAMEAARAADAATRRRQRGEQR
jgi:hypothetical protein